VKRGVVNVARFGRVLLLARRGWLGALQPTREATGCHGWLAALAPVGGSGWQPRPRSGGQAGPTLCCRGGGRLVGLAATSSRQRTGRRPTTGGGARLGEASTTLLLLLLLLA